MRRIVPLLLVGLLAVGGLGIATTWNAAERTIAASNGGDDEDHGKNDDRDRSRDRDDADDTPSGDDDATQTPTASTGAATATGTREVHTAGERFDPARLTIRAGESVTFVNDDDDEHTATGDGFDTGKMNEGDAVTITFDAPGTFVYVCQFHADMQAEIVVLPPDGTPQASPVASPAATAVASPAAERVDIDILNFEFGPPTVTIRPGTTVVWTNASPTPHTVTGDFADSGILQSGDTFAWTFTDAGTFTYICNLHPQMEATIVVDPNAP